MFVFNSQNELTRGEMLTLITGGQKFVQSMNEGIIGFLPFCLPDQSTLYCALLFWGMSVPELRIKPSFEILYIPSTT